MARVIFGLLGVDVRVADLAATRPAGSAAVQASGAGRPPRPRLASSHRKRPAPPRPR
jgi:hypothetical protein